MLCEPPMDEAQQDVSEDLYYYNTTFVGDFFTCTVPVELRYGDEDDDYIITCADAIMQHTCGWSPLDHANVSVEVERD